MKQRINEEWTVIQDALLAILLGGLIINYVPAIIDPEVRAAQKKSWIEWGKRWMERLEKVKNISPAYRRKAERVLQQKLTKENIRQAINDFGGGKITIDEFEDIVTNLDPSIKEAVKTLIEGPSDSQRYYDRDAAKRRFYNVLKDALDISTVAGTPIANIKKEFDRKGKEFEKEKRFLQKNLQDVLSLWGDYKANTETLRTVAKDARMPKVVELIEDAIVNGPTPERRNYVYSNIRHLFRTNTIDKTPAKKVWARINREAQNAVLEKPSLESLADLRMPRLNEIWDTL